MKMITSGSTKIWLNESMAAKTEEEIAAVVKEINLAMGAGLKKAAMLQTQKEGVV